MSNPRPSLPSLAAHKPDGHFRSELFAVSRSVGALGRIAPVIFSIILIVPDVHLGESIVASSSDGGSHIDFNGIGVIPGPVFLFAR